jgi:(1->4)-alpha-D-glucan 1-alpha-D-glucosylmutase
MPGGAAARRPAPGRPVPTATYRLQVQPAFTFAEAADQADYLATLGVSHAYLAPVLEAAPGSTHGYDVVDHSRLSDQLGGAAAFAALVDRLGAHGLGAVADVVPNHMAVPAPAHLNRQWWSVLREGPSSANASWFDIDWQAGDGQVLMPVLGTGLEEALAAGELAVDGHGGSAGDETVIRYHDHEFPVRAGTESLPLAALVRAQFYRLAHWREGGDRLNYRRFFDVTSLAAVRVEDPAVFDATHELLVDLVRRGDLDGLRIDHPDGLHDPRGYLERLGDVTGGVWVVVEKILEGEEQLPSDWRCAGTTGYDALMRVGGLFVDPAGAEPLSALLAEVTGEEQDLAVMVEAAKRQVVEGVQAAEVHRLLGLVSRLAPGEDTARVRRSLVALLVSMDCYRAYVVPGEPPPAESVRTIDGACERARQRLPDADHAVLALLRDLVLGVGAGAQARQADAAAADEFCVRFQQTCGPVMAKAVEDTAFYRYARLAALNEVGGDPAHLGVFPQEFHAFADRLLAHLPTTMTTLSTHDTKRSEDVRARLAVISERPGPWRTWLTEARRVAAAHRGTELDPATEYLLWQSAVGAWPIDSRRLGDYATKAVREAKQHTSWTEPDEAYDAAVQGFVAGIVDDPAVTAHIERWVEQTREATRAAVLGQKLLQLTMPGVPDVYQGTELVDLSLVDPDNRRPIDYDSRRRRLARLDRGKAPQDLDDEKLLVTSRALRLRRDRPQWFTGEEACYVPLEVSSPHAVGFGRGDRSGVQVVALATRLAARLEESGGWGGETVALPAGRWADLLTGRPVQAAGATAGGGVRLAELLGRLPVALLVRHDPR